MAKKVFRKLFRGKYGQVNIPTIIISAILAILVLALLPAIRIAVQGGDWSAQGATEYLNNAGYTVTSPSGTVYVDDLLPNTDSTWDIGASGTEFAEGWFDKLYSGGSEVVRAATLVIAASDSTATGIAQSDYQCNGINDHLEIQTAIDALPATGGEVFLLDGTYNIEANLDLDSYQTLRGCGRNTILTTTSAGTDIIYITGSSSNEKIGILITDLCIDGTAGGASVSLAIYIEYMDYSKISNIWIENCDYAMWLIQCDNNITSDNFLSGIGSICIYMEVNSGNIISRNNCQGDGFGINLTSCPNSIISRNVLQGLGKEGIWIQSCANSIISGNILRGNGTGATKYSGIYMSYSDESVVVGNQCKENGLHGIEIFRSSYCTVVGNVCNNQETGDGISVTGDATTNSDYNSITGNVCTGNADDGIAIEGVGDANKNIVLGNQLLGNTGTPLVDNGTATVSEHNITA